MGQIIGAVVADSQPHAQRAAKAVKIEYEELQPVITIQVRQMRQKPGGCAVQEIFTNIRFLASLTGSHHCSILL